MKMLRPDPYASNDEWVAAGFPVPEPSADCRVSVARVAGPLTLWVEFVDGVRGHVRWEQSALRGVFEVLRDPSFFELAKVEDGVVCWPGEIDVSPDNMHRHLMAFGEWVLR